MMGPGGVGPALRLALVTTCVGVLVGASAGVVVGVRAFRAINVPSVSTPGEIQRQLGAGTWIIFQRRDTGAPDLGSGQVKVTGPDGRPVSVGPATPNETITKGTRIYTSAQQFDAPTAGRYAIEINTPAAGEVIIARSLGRTFRSLIAPVVVGVIGGALVLTGVVMLIVGATRRSRAARPTVATVAAPGPPPGWYPDPQVPGGQRWWDGSRWT